MKKNLLFFLSFVILGTAHAQFGTFASAVYVNINGSAQFYNANTQQPDPNAIGGIDFRGADLGTYSQNSGALTIAGAELKTYKNTNGNVCSSTMYYTVYPAGNRPASPVYTAMNMPFFSDCNTALDSFDLGGGPCQAGDQKWQANPGNTTAADLTTNAPGTYTFEAYFQANGTNDNNCGDAVVYDNNNADPANYTATFTITSTAPVALQSFTAINKNTTVLLQWIDNEEVNSKGFEIERSIDGKNYTAIGWVNTKSNGTNLTNSYSFNDNDVQTASKVYYRLKIEDNNGSFRYSYIVPVSLNYAAPMRVQLNGNTVTITTSGLSKGKYAMQLFSVDGKLIANKNMQVTSNAAQSIQLQSGNLPKGVYMVAVRNAAGELVSKTNFIKQ